MGRANWWGLSMVELLLAYSFDLHTLHITYYINLHISESLLLPGFAITLLLLVLAPVSCLPPPCSVFLFPLCLGLHLTFHLVFPPLFSLSFSVCSHPISTPCLWFPLCFPSLDLSFLWVFLGVSPTPLLFYPGSPSVLFYSRFLICFLLSNFPSSPCFSLFPHMPQSLPQSLIPLLP